MHARSNATMRAASFVVPLLLAISASQAAFADPADKQQACQSDAMIVFDASGSMGTTDFTLKVPRIAGAKNAMRRVIPEVADLRRLGLLVYGEGEYNDCNSIELRLRPTANAAATLLHEIESVNPRGRTPLTEAVKQAAEVLEFRHRESTVVLLTDGEETCGGDPCKVAGALKAAAKGLTIHVIGYRHGIVGYFASRCMADLTGGEYVSATNEKELVEALRKTLGCPFVTDRQEHQPQRFAQSFASPQGRFCACREYTRDKRWSMRTSGAEDNFPTVK